MPYPRRSFPLRSRSLSPPAPSVYRSHPFAPSACDRCGPGALPHRHTQAQSSPSFEAQGLPSPPQLPRWGSRYRRPGLASRGSRQPGRLPANARQRSRGSGPGSRAPPPTAATGGTAPRLAPQPVHPAQNRAGQRRPPGRAREGTERHRHGRAPRAATVAPGAPRRGGGGRDSLPRGSSRRHRPRPGLVSPGRYRPGAGRARVRAAPGTHLPAGRERLGRGRASRPEKPRHRPVPSRRPSYRRPPPLPLPAPAPTVM